VKTIKVIGLLALVFAAGFTGGVVATKVFVRQMVDYAVAHPERARTHVEQNTELNLNRKLRLDQQQREQVRQILKDSQARLRVVREQFQPKFNAITRETRTNISVLLKPDQQERFEQFLADNRQFLPLRELSPKKNPDAGVPK
jgi:ferric-dicitrate binding protein FerR (iron transport regulator)